MTTTRALNLSITEKLRKNIIYRKAFFRASTADNIAVDIKNLRELRDNMTQAKLAELCGMKQSAISRIERADYSAWTFNTLVRVAEALDARLVINFQPVEEAIKGFTSTKNDVNKRMG